MRVEIDVPVIVTGRMKASHSIKWVFGSVTRVFHLPEYSASEVPAVLAYTEISEEGSKARTEFRGVEGRLFTDRMASAVGDDAMRFHFDRWDRRKAHPFFVAADVAVKARIDYIRRESQALAHQKMIPASLHDHSDSMASAHPFVFSTIEELGVRDVEDAAIEKQVDEFRSRMERVILVDGRVLLEEQEPIIRIDGYAAYVPTVNAGVLRRHEPMRLVTMENDPRGTPYAYMSLADHADMDQAAEAVADRFTTADPTVSHIADVEVIDPTYLRLSGEALTMAACADMMRSSFLDTLYIPASDSRRTKDRLESHLMGLDPAVLGCAQRLRTGIAASDETGIDPMLEQAVSDAVELGRASGSSRTFGRESVVEHAAAALEAWHDRQVSVDFSPGPRLRA